MEVVAEVAAEVAEAVEAVTVVEVPTTMEEIGDVHHMIPTAPRLPTTLMHQDG